MAGLQCVRRMWWEQHERDAPELVPTPFLQSIFDHGNVVGEVARGYVPHGLLIGGPPLSLEDRAQRTREAIDAGARVIYEAAFLADGVFVAVDILERVSDGYVLIEVKSTLDVGDKHIPDVAVQLYALERAGLNVVRAELMHLNRECRYPDLTNLFVREDVTERAREALQSMPAQIARLQSILAGELPTVAIGGHCSTPYACAFERRCWPAKEADGITTLHNLRKAKAAKMIAAGCVSITQLPSDYRATGPAARQIESLRSGHSIIDARLGNALRQFTPPLAFLDFETIAPPIPRWPGLAPMAKVPVQFSVYTVDENGEREHPWLAEGALDPRPALADALLTACAGAQTVLAYQAEFEKSRIKELAAALPDRAAALLDLESRIADVLPVVRDFTYHPAYGGSFSLKKVLPALVDGLGYDDLELADGASAATLLEKLLFDSASLGAEGVAHARSVLTKYCGRDTYGLVRLHARLWELAAAQGAGA
ncbi:MAG: DUF2779 domain-containing protein [Sandaracinaceae bacterium]|nr:DUF2779 domain-containing protein [Sandaracinaceae bacterium]